MPTDLVPYGQVLLDLYLRLPDTPRRLSRYDSRLVRQLWEQDVSGYPLVYGDSVKEPDHR